MDIRFLLLFILPAVATAGTYSDETVSLGMDNEDKEFDNSGSYKTEGEYSVAGSVSADIFNEGSHLAGAAAEEWGMKAKTVEQNAKWFRNLLNEKQMILGQVKKRLGLLHALATENLQNAEQYRLSAAEKCQSSKALETKARESHNLNKDYAVQVHELRAKLNNELKQHLDALISSRVAEANANTDIAEAEIQRSWAEFLEKQAQDMLSEAAKWERSSTENLNSAKKFKLEAAAEKAKAKELEKKRKEALDAAMEAERKALDFYQFHLEFHMKAQAEEHQGGQIKVKAKYLQMMAASLLDSASQLRMFANLQNKDKSLWEKKTASAKAEANLLEASADKMLQNIEKLKKSLQASSKVAQKSNELVPQEEKSVKSEPRAITPDKKV
uniref:Ootheca protein n=1 Tax=Tenodera australasiae TaxID=267140 RepID=I3PM84_9NEOP|nr:ootheca protein [Tenodera australasiae]